MSWKINILRGDMLLQKVGLNTEKSDFENGNISLFLFQKKIK